MTNAHVERQIKNQRQAREYYQTADRAFYGEAAARGKLRIAEREAKQALVITALGTVWWGDPMANWMVDQGYSAGEVAAAIQETRGRQSLSTAGGDRGRG